MKIFLLVLISVFAAGAQTRTVTNSDLEKFRQEREKAEADYRANYAKRGMPSPEELAKINEQKRRDRDQFAAELRSRRESAESEIVYRARLIRSQLASVNSQIGYLLGIRGSSFSQPRTYWSYVYQNYGYQRRPVYSARAATQLPTNLQTVTDISRMYPNSTDVYNRSIGNYAFLNQRPRGGLYRGGYLAPILVTVGDSIQIDTQILYLEQIRAELQAEWRLVEEEARRAGIRID